MLVLQPLVLLAAATPNNARDCYGCIGWCTYGDVCSPPPTAVWHDAAKDINVHGRGWPEEAMGGKPYYRFPAHAEAIPGLAKGNEEVWTKSQRSAGINTRFATSAADLWVHWELAEGQPRGDWLWPSVGHCGVDIYIEDEDWPTGQRWATSSGNNPMMSKAKNGTLYTGLFNIPPRPDGRPRNFTVYFPLSSATNTVAVAALSAHGQSNVPLVPLPPPVNASLRGSERPVLWVGTSIMNGAAANRPGMGWPQQASRMLGMEGVNLGFGGMGRMQPFYAESGLLAEVNASIMVVDCEFNMAGALGPLETFNRTLVFLGAQRRRRPDIPVLLLEGHDHGSAWINAAARSEHNATREAYRRAYNQLLSEGVRGLYYGAHTLKFGGRPTATDFQAQVSTVAGVHPKPLGLRELATYGSALIIEVLEGRASDSTPQPTGGRWPPSPAPPAPRPPAPPAPPGACAQRAGGFIGGNVGKLEGVRSWEACCHVCSAKPQCAKWVWVASSKECNLHSAAAPWGAGPSSDPRLCGQVRNSSSLASGESAAAAIELSTGEEEAGEWLSDAALEEERWRTGILGWSSDPIDTPGSLGSSLVWTDAMKLGVEGKGWGASDSANYWQRLPDSANGVVPDGIWKLSTQTSGILVRFTSNSSSVGIAIQRGAGLPPNTDDIFTTNGTGLQNVWGQTTF